MGFITVLAIIVCSYGVVKGYNGMKRGRMIRAKSKATVVGVILFIAFIFSPSSFVLILLISAMVFTCVKFISLFKRINA